MNGSRRWIVLVVGTFVFGAGLAVALALGTPPAQSSSSLCPITRECTTESVAPQCSDGLDNDGDGKTDFPADPGCSSSSDSTESPNPQCSNGADDDGDGKTDFPADLGCTSTRDTSESPDPPQCSNGVDDDGDGKVDTADPGCSSSSDNSESPDPAGTTGTTTQTTTTTPTSTATTTTSTSTSSSTTVVTVTSTTTVTTDPERPKRPKGPKQGKVKRAWMSLPGSSIPFTHVSRASGLQANFVFSLRPFKGYRLRAVWYRRNVLLGAAGKPRTDKVVSILKIGRELPRGFYRCILAVRAPGAKGWKPLKTVSIGIG